MESVYHFVNARYMPSLEGTRRARALSQFPLEVGLLNGSPESKGDYQGLSKF